MPGRRAHRLDLFLAGVLLAGLLSACIAPRETIPGDTNFIIEELEITGNETLSTGVLESGGLSLRPSGLTAPPQPYNPYRVGEDRRRLYAFYQNFGYFDVEVLGPEVDLDEATETAKISWQIKEGQPYTVASLAVSGAPEGFESELLDSAPFGKGDSVDMETYRRHRFAMSDPLLDAGWLHATIYSRAYIDRDKREVHWVYFVDPGPRTRVGSIEVIGNSKIPTEDVLWRAGIEPGEPIDGQRLREAELALLDAGSFHHANIITDADVPERVRPLPPDTGGVMKPEQIGANGELIPRDLAEELNLKVVVAEAPAFQGRVGGGGQADLARVDALATGELWMRDLFAPFHHLVVEGQVGYGHLWRETTDEPLGLYGAAMLRYIWAGAFGRLVDFRLTGRFDDRLFPGYHTREVTAGPGIRTAFTEDLFFDLDILYRYAFTDGYEGFTDATAAMELIDPAVGEAGYHEGEVQTSLIYDGRNHRIEPTDGGFASLSASIAPGDPVGEHGYVGLDTDLRLFIPLTSSLSLALKTVAGWAFAIGDNGVPPTARIFGGGNYGMRGFGRQQLSSYATRCDATMSDCDAIPVGGRSTVQGTVELRWLPFRQLYGAAVFADLGSVGDSENPFEEGVNLAVGGGLRIRVFWYVSLNLDFAYRVLDDSRVSDLDLDSFQFFMRLSEAF